MVHCPAAVVKKKKMFWIKFSLLILEKNQFACELHDLDHLDLEDDILSWGLM